MKVLYIIRHAKSSWKDSTLDDYDRPLNKRGSKNAPFMGKRLKKKNVTPDIIISSPALRAKATAQLIAKEVEYDEDIEFKEEIYESSFDILHNILKQVDDTKHIAFLVGHNSGINMLAKIYVDFNENIVTCGVFKIEFKCNSWSEINTKNAKFISLDYPKKH